MFLEWVNSCWTAIVLGGFAVIFISAVTIKLDNKLICAGKTFKNIVENHPRSSSRMSHYFLQITPMISSFLCLLVMMLGFVIYNIS